MFDIIEKMFNVHKNKSSTLKRKLDGKINLYTHCIGWVLKSL